MKKFLIMLLMVLMSLLILTGCPDSMGVDLYLTSETTAVDVDRVAPTTEDVTSLVVTLAALKCTAPPLVSIQGGFRFLLQEKVLI